MSKGESQQQEQSRGVRKSHRHKVPNPRYIEGSNSNDMKNPLKTRKKGKNSELLNNNHFESEPISKAELQFNQDQLWYPCRLTNNTQIKVQFIIGAEVNYQVPKLDKKRDPLNLLSLVQQTIQNVNGKIIVEESTPYQPKRGDFQQRKYKPIPRVQLEQDIDGRLISIHIQSNTLKIQHSKMGTYQMPIQTNKCTLKMQQENNEEKMRLQSYQQILNKSKILSTITILN